MELLSERDDEVRADRHLPALHRASRVPLRECEARGGVDEALHLETAGAEDRLDASDRRADELELFARDVAEQHLVLEVLADDLSLATNEENHHHPEREDEDEPERQQDEEERKLQRVAEHRRPVPRRVERHRDHVANDRRREFEDAAARLARDAEADSRHRGVERVTPWRENAAQNERPRKRREAALRARAPVIENIFGHREPERRERRVDHPVHDSVELAMQEEEDAEHRETLETLLDDRRADHRADEFRRVLAADRARDLAVDRVDPGREPASGNRAPEKRHRERPPWLRIIAIDDDRHPHVEKARNHRENAAEHHREKEPARVARTENHAPEEEDQQEPADHEPEDPEREPHPLHRRIPLRERLLHAAQ